MTIRLKVTAKEFDLAEADGAVFGKYLSSQPPLFAYAELGAEIEDYSPRNPSPQTRYRCFIHCNVFYAKTARECSDYRFIDPKTLGKAGDELSRMMCDQRVIIYN